MEEESMTLEFSICEVRWEQYRRVPENPQNRTSAQMLGKRLGLSAKILDVVAPGARTPSGNPSFHPRSLPGFVLRGVHGLLLLAMNSSC
jgi:hypothetical protein